MPRITDSNQISALGSKVLLSADILKISFGCTNSDYTDQAACELNNGIWTDDINLTTFHRDITVAVDIQDGNGGISTSFQSTSDLLNLPEIDETLAMDLSTIEINIAAITNDWLLKAQSIEILNRPVWIWRVLYDPDTLAMVGEPFQIFGGYITGGDIDFTIIEDGSSVNLQASNQFYDFERVAGFRCSVSEHQSFFPNDTGFQFTSGVERDIEWL